MITLDTERKQDRFRKEAIKRAAHHAKAVAEIAPVVVDAIIRHADNGSLRGNTYNGHMTGSGWAAFKGRRIYAHFHKTLNSIVVREGAIGGKILLSFTDKNSHSSIDRQIKDLRRGHLKKNMRRK